MTLTTFSSSVVILTVDKVESQQLNDGQLVIGFATKQLLDKLVNESDKRKRDQFY